jgi:ligand-binding SRPBCC domain-containing protein
VKHTIRTSLFLPLDRPSVFAFFSDPANLGRITPPKMRFQMLTPMPIIMESGALIDYRIRAIIVPLRWRSLIERWDPPREFVDVQLAGPYKQWVHTHRFVEQSGGTLVEDHVEYALPFQPFGEIVHWAVRRQLDRIFQFRREMIEQILMPPKDHPAVL